MQCATTTWQEQDELTRILHKSGLEDSQNQEEIGRKSGILYRISGRNMEFIESSQDFVTL